MKLCPLSILRLLIFTFLVGTIFPCFAAEPVFPGLYAIMTDAEWKRAGLDHLTPDQIGVIDAALIRHLVRQSATAATPTPAVVPTAPAPAPPTSAPKVKSGLLERFGLTHNSGPDWRDQPPLEARATGWLTVNRFTLDNGQVWEGTEAIPFDVAGKDVVIEARPNESFALKLKSGSAPVRVRRIK